MAEFLLQLTDEVPIKADISQTPWNKLVSDIVAYGQANNLGNAFMLLDVGRTFAGVMIRFFNINSDTAYLATTNYINDNNMIGIYADNITSSSTSCYWVINWSGTIGNSYSAANFVQRTVGGVTYY